jgi:competence protein ComEA
MRMTEKPNLERLKPRAKWQPLLRAADQAVVASMVLLALAAMGVYWIVQGGPRGELIEIDRATPLVARFQVDVNKAEWPELAQLPEVGEVLARRIVDARVREGAFVDHDDLLRVNGIGPLTLQKMKPYLLPLPAKNAVADDRAPQTLPVP